MDVINTIDSFKADFENIHIYSEKLALQPFKEFKEDSQDWLTDTVHVYTDMEHHYYVNGCDLVGKLDILFRSQGSDGELYFRLSGTFIVNSVVDNSPRSVFTKFVQYLFGYAQNYIRSNSIMGENNEPFVMPSFTYSKDHFLHFPDK